MFFIPIKSSMAPGDPSGGERFGRALCQLARRRLARGHPNRCFFSDFWGHCFDNLATVKLIYQCRSRQPCARQRRTGQVMRIWMFDSDLFCTFWMHFVHSNLPFLCRFFFWPVASRRLSALEARGLVVSLVSVETFWCEFIPIRNIQPGSGWWYWWCLLRFVDVCSSLLPFSNCMWQLGGVRSKHPWQFAGRCFIFFHIVSSC